MFLSLIPEYIKVLFNLPSYFKGEEGECESVGGEESEGGSACESSISRAEGGSPVSSSSLGSQSLELPVAPPGSRPEAELQVSHVIDGLIILTDTIACFLLVSSA